MRVSIVLVGVAALWCNADSVAAQQAGEQNTSNSGIIVDGSKDTAIGGLPAARMGDPATDGSAVVGGSPDVLINGRPAAVMGDQTNCRGRVVAGGTSNVFINGKPAAHVGNVTSGCPDP